jgi:predicted kinase
MGLTMLMGLARSGKSTIAKRWVNYEIDIKNGKLIHRGINKQPDELPRVIVCADDIRLTFGHRFNYLMEDYISAIKYTMIKTLLMKHDVLNDATSTTKGSIYKLLEIDENAEFYRMDTSAETCKLRAKETNQEDLIPVIDRMAKQLEKLPSIDEIREEVIAAKQFRKIV